MTERDPLRRVIGVSQKEPWNEMLEIAVTEPDNDNIAVTAPIYTHDYYTGWLLLFGIIGIAGAALGSLWSITYHYIWAPRYNWVMAGLILFYSIHFVIYHYDNMAYVRRNLPQYVGWSFFFYVLFTGLVISNLVVQWTMLDCSKLQNASQNSNDFTPAQINTVCLSEPYARSKIVNFIWVAAVTFFQVVGLYFFYQWKCHVNEEKDNIGAQQLYDSAPKRQSMRARRRNGRYKRV